MTNEPARPAPQNGPGFRVGVTAVRIIQLHDLGGGDEVPRIRGERVMWQAGTAKIRGSHLLNNVRKPDD